MIPARTPHTIPAYLQNQPTYRHTYPYIHTCLALLDLAHTYLLAYPHTYMTICQPTSIPTRFLPTYILSKRPTPTSCLPPQAYLHTYLLATCHATLDIQSYAQMCLLNFFHTYGLACLPPYRFTN